MLESLFNISPIDGRYFDDVSEVREVFSEYHLIKNRVLVEIEWLKKLQTIEELNIDKKHLRKFDKIVKKFNVAEAMKVKEIESVTHHDVKAVEYYINNKLKELEIENYSPLTHFLCTSEDINNLAYGIMEEELLNVYIKNGVSLIDTLRNMSKKYAGIPMLSHTHGQSATPTTVGKELSIFVYRLEKILNLLKGLKITGKFNGTVGNFNAHNLAFENIDWIEFNKSFVESLGLEFNLYTTQIESHDTISIMFSYMKMFNNIVLDLDSDMWTYISLGYFKQENKKGEVGSSVMPHKINPINYENSMANLKMANGILTTFIDSFEISRMQRDLSDSSMLRNIGVGVAHSVLAITQTIKGLNKVSPNEERLASDLESNPEVLAEAIQTILRKNMCENAYETLKEMTRGKKVTLESIREFIKGLDIDKKDKEKLLKLTPATYVGLAEKLANII